MSHIPNNFEPDDKMAVPRTEIKTWLTYDTMSPLGQALMKIAAENDQADGTAFDEQAIEDELKIRRGGHSEDGE